MDITFILPTYNRKDTVVRAIDSCLKVHEKSEKISISVIVLDGYSNDGAWEILQEHYEANPNIELIQVSKEKGFQETAFLGLDLVKTEYVTYMYNDDVLSDYYHQMAEAMLENNQEFIMGYGSNYQVEGTMHFKALDIKEEPKNNILLAYFGIFKNLNYSSLPVSPIASISKTKNLLNWRDEVRTFVSNSSLRNDLMMKQNIGPDLILYLYGLFLSKQKLLFCNSTAAQLSFHKDSMSILYGKTPLSTGYWLSRIWFLEKYISEESHYDKDFLGQISAYIVISGLLVVTLNLFSLRFNYVLSSFREIFKVFILTIKFGFFIKTLFYIPFIIKNRFFRDKNKLTPN